MTSYLYSLFLNYVTKVMLFFYIQTKNNVFFRDSSKPIILISLSIIPGCLFCVIEGGKMFCQFQLLVRSSRLPLGLIGR